MEMTMYWRWKLQVCENRWFKSVKQHWIYSLIGSLNLVFENTRITVKRAVAQKDLHKISVHAKSHNIMYGIINLEDITDITLLDVVTHIKNPHLPTFHIMVWRLRREKKLKLYLLVNEIEFFRQSSIVIILLFSSKFYKNVTTFSTFQWTSYMIGKIM